MNETQALLFARQLAAGEPVTAEAQLAFRAWVLQHADTETEQLLETLMQEVQVHGVTAPIPAEWTQRLLQTIEAEEKRNTIVTMRPARSNRFRIITAAAMIAVLATGAWFFFRSSPAIEGTARFEKNDVPPGSAKASLTLADGSVVVLDEQQNGQLAKQGQVSVIKSDSGQLVYRVLPADIATSSRITASGTIQPEYNTLHTPRGGQYRLLLPDGSKVWLNAASSLRFPTAFTGKERRVELTGEAYFEVAKAPQDKVMPFKVLVNKTEVAVLGTHFNIHAYENEPATTVTLLEGKVRVGQGADGRILTPGQAAIVNADGITVAETADTEEAIAWKNGLFQFSNTPLQQVLHQVERWYNVQIDYSHMPDKHFYGIVSRNVRLSQVLSMLEVTGGVKFTLEGNTLKVTR